MSHFETNFNAVFKPYEAGVNDAKENRFPRKHQEREYYEGYKSVLQRQMKESVEPAHSQLKDVL